jgi:adenylate cyclase
MPLAREQRRLAAIMAADVVGYSRLMGRDESGTLARLKGHRSERLEPALTRNGGRLVKLTGDGVLAEFGSAVDALRAAIEVQQAVAETNRELPEDTRIAFRIGVHLGDLIVDGDDLYGDGVNVAARLEAEAPPGGIIVSRAVREAVEGRLKARLHALGELALKNIERPIRAFRVEWEEADWPPQATPAPKPPEPAQSPTPSLALPDKPSIAVLPFQNMSGDPEQEYFSDGISEDIITDLSRFHALFVIARNSSFVYRDVHKDLRQVARELGVRYIVEGSVRKSGNRIRISAQLIDAGGGAHLWADRYDRELVDVFAVQDEVTRSIVSRLIAHIDKAEIGRAQQKPPETLEVYDLFLRARALDHMAYGAPNRGEVLDRGRQLYEQALARDPTYAPAWAALSFLYVFLWIEPPIYEPLDAEYHNPATLDRAVALAEKAVLLDPELPAAHAALGWVLLWKMRPHDALAAFGRVLELNPNEVPYGYGDALTYAHRAEEAVEMIERAMRLDPFHPSVLFGHLGHALYMLGQDEAAAEVLRTCVRRAPHFRPGFFWLAAATARFGRIDEARLAAAEVMRIEPEFRISTFLGRTPYVDRRDAEHLAESMRKAGLPE